MEKCATGGIDIVNVQEPWCGHNTRTQTRGEFSILSPVHKLGGNQPDVDRTKANKELARNRPRVLTYILKGVRLSATKTRLSEGRDSLWMSVNGIQIFNIYRENGSDTVLDEVRDLEPEPRSLVGGDFNLIYSRAERLRSDRRVGDKLAE